MALLFAFTCGLSAVPRLLTVGLNNAAIHLGQLGLRPASYTRDGMWAPKESVQAGAEPKDWSVVVVSGREVDAKMSEFARAAAESSTTELVVAGVGEDSEAWLRLARRGVGLLTLSEAELGVVEGWLLSETGAAPPPPPAAALVGSVRSVRSVRDRATELGGTLGAARVCVTRGRRGAALWCEGGRRPNGMRSSMVTLPPFGRAHRSAPVPPRGVPGGSGQLGTPKKSPPTALGARASRLQSRRFYRPLTTHLLCDRGGMRETQGALWPSRRKMDRFFEHPGFEVRLVVLARFIGALEGNQHEAIYARIYIHTYTYACACACYIYTFIHTRLGRPRHRCTHRETQGFYSICGCLIVAGNTP